MQRGPWPCPMSFTEVTAIHKQGDVPFLMLITHNEVEGNGDIVEFKHKYEIFNVLVERKYRKR